MSVGQEIIRDHAVDLAWVESAKFEDEAVTVARLLADIRADDAQLSRIEHDAAGLVETFRATPALKTLLDSFLQEYGLSNDEGIALMCLAEALLRVPDAATRDDFIADRLGAGEWSSHLGESEALLVNASTWGLMLTGKVSTLDRDRTNSPLAMIKRLTNRVGEPVIRLAVARAMKILGGEFVLGETIRQAIRRGRRDYGDAQLYSFDMLGEGARTHADAQRYFEAYKGALEATARMGESGPVTARSGISVKLSALYPRYEYAKRDDVLDVVVDRFGQLVRMARDAGLKITMDAEEADRLGLSLEIYERVARDVHAAPNGWPGLGLAIQAYGKRARRVIAWTAQLGRELNCRFMVRLVKGAYWDAEIKHAQELGLPGFPVFTRKSTTDLSYLVCAQDMLDNTDVLFCQFATHNAHTVAAIMSLGEGRVRNFEFQRLYGMGEGIYKVAAQTWPDLPPVRIYAPVGGHKDLLAYLVRRLLENGANSSFVNRFMDARVAANDVVRDPVRITRRLDVIPHPGIRSPENLFKDSSAMSRDNSTGLDLNSPEVMQALEQAQSAVYSERFDVASVCAGLAVDSTRVDLIRNPALHEDTLGNAVAADPARMDALFEAASRAQPDWNARGGAERASILRRAADALDAQTLRFMAILSREAGKTQADALAEVREAVDFLRYYAGQAAAEFSTGETLPGPSGEANSLHLSGRGVFVAISPWNFPLAIFLGQVAAALAAGNAVIAKPAEQTPIVAVEVTQLMIAAGIPPDVMMTVLGNGAVGAALVDHPRTAGVAFTGSTGTAKRINLSLAQKDGAIVPLIAETGGQNVMFVDSTALPEQVTDDVITSAFLSAGQRCSALRVLYLQDDIADATLDMIRGAMDTLSLGDPRYLSTDVGPVIDDTARAGLQGHIDAMTARGFAHHSPGAADAAAQPGTFVAPHLFEIDSIETLDREHFGPVLHVVRYAARDLDAALESAFSTGFGLTMGVHTRMESRWQDIFARAPVGNTYINRNMTGAVVGSQPFGGQGLSGTGFKAGGPRYLYRFATEKTLTVNTMASGGNTELLTLN